MTILHLVPKDTLERIRAGDTGIREDLRIIPAAERAGWTASFLHNDWYHFASFRKDDTFVWSSSTCWVRARRGAGAHYHGHDYFQTAEAALNIDAEAAKDPSPPPERHTYLFDLKLTAALRVKAPSEQAARAKLAELLDCAEANFGRDDDGWPLIAEVSLNSEESADCVLVEVDPPDSETGA